MKISYLLFIALVFLCSLCTAQIQPGENQIPEDSIVTSTKISTKPVKPFDWVDTSSPRDVFTSLLTGTQRYYELIRHAGYTHENWDEIVNIGMQAERLFDLRDIPPGSREDFSHEIMVLLRESLARIPLPSLNDIPDDEELTTHIQNGGSTIFQIPNTPFEIARIEEGPQSGRYQFTRETVSQVHSFFDEIRHYPYEPSQKSVEGLYEAYFLSPGPAIPHGWIKSLPHWMKMEFLDQRVWQWCVLLITCLLFVVSIYALHILIKRLSRNFKELPQSIVLLIRPAILILLVTVTTRFLYYDVRITADVARVVDFIKHLVILMASVLITLRLGGVLSEFFLSSKRLIDHVIDQQFIRLLFRVAALIISIVIVIEEMQQIGFSFATLLAGASVSGLAIALAAQDTLKNIFGGIELALDKPFDVGHRILLKGYDGEIEQIGLRSTKIRTRTGHHVTIPNEEMAKLDIENIDRRPYIRRRFNISITYDTPVEKINEAISILLEILSVPETSDDSENPEQEYQMEVAKHPNEAINNPAYPPRVFFSDLTADSLNLLIYYWYFPPDHWSFKSHESWVNLQIIKRFNAAKIEFAFPTQTIHLADSDDSHPNRDAETLTSPDENMD